MIGAVKCQMVNGICKVGGVVFICVNDVLI